VQGIFLFFFVVLILRKISGSPRQEAALSNTTAVANVRRAVARCRRVHKKKDLRKARCNLVRTIQEELPLLTQKPELQRVFLNSVFRAVGQLPLDAKTTVSVLRTTDEDFYLSSSGDDVKLVLSDDSDASWFALWCGNVSQAVLHVREESGALVAVDARAAKAEAAAALFPRLNKHVQVPAEWSLSYDANARSPQVIVWLAAVCGTSHYQACDYMHPIIVKNKLSVEKRIFLSVSLIGMSSLFLFNSTSPRRRGASGWTSSSQASCQRRWRRCRPSTGSFRGFAGRSAGSSSRAWSSSIGPPWTRSRRTSTWLVA